MPATVRQYELVYIIQVDRSEEQVRAVIDKYNNLITSQGGEVERTDIWERRRLAYEIKGQTEGIYIICIFRGLPNVEAELRRVFRISEDTIRFIIVRPDDEIDPALPSVQPGSVFGRPERGPDRGYDRGPDRGFDRGPAPVAQEVPQEPAAAPEEPVAEGEAEAQEPVGATA
jgi:small subunit ribosomal protein S6